MTSAGQAMHLWSEPASFSDTFPGGSTVFVSLTFKYCCWPSRRAKQLKTWQPVSIAQLALVNTCQAGIVKGILLSHTMPHLSDATSSLQYSAQNFKHLDY